MYISQAQFLCTMSVAMFFAYAGTNCPFFGKTMKEICWLMAIFWWLAIEVLSLTSNFIN